MKIILNLLLLHDRSKDVILLILIFYIMWTTYFNYCVHKLDITTIILIGTVTGKYISIVKKVWKYQSHFRTRKSNKGKSYNGQTTKIVFLIVCLYMYYRWRSSYKKKGGGGVGISLISLTPPVLCPT